MLDDSGTERDTETLRAIPSSPGGSSGSLGSRDSGRSFLFVIEEDTSSLVPLPEVGEVLIGRALEALVRLHDPATSRRHAVLSVNPSEIRIRDLDSHNGTYVNGERISLPRPLMSRDTISICKATLILHRETVSVRELSFIDFAVLRRRLEEEIERALRYRRPLSLLVFEFSGESDRGRVHRALSEALSRIDLPSWEGTSRLHILMPELVAEEVMPRALRLLEVLRPLAASVRCGFSSCPADGSDADTLLAGARTAASSAAPYEVLPAAFAKVVRKVDDQEVILADPAMQRGYQLVERLSQSSIPVLISGETGTGKELVARALHYWSPRKSGPLVNVNCATLNESIAESLLFGHIKGAFTGAHAEQRGLLQSANGGTVFLDELGELGLSVQGKLLRALETSKVLPVGASSERSIDVRVIAATNRDLLREIREGRFREDLYWRIRAGAVALPPLRSRKRELPILARSFLEAACKKQRSAELRLSDPVMERLLAHPWPGNVRQLKNEMEFLAATVEEPVVELWHLSESLDSAEPVRGELAGELSSSSKKSSRPNLQEEVRALEQGRIRDAMVAAGGAVKEAAAILGMPPRTLYYKLRHYEIHSTERADAMDTTR